MAFFEGSYIFADCFDVSSHDRAEYRPSRSCKSDRQPPPERHDDRQVRAAHERVAGRHCGGVDFYEHFVVFRRGLFNLRELKNPRRLILDAYNRFHKSPKILLVLLFHLVTNVLGDKLPRYAMAGSVRMA